MQAAAAGIQVQAGRQVWMLDRLVDQLPACGQSWIATKHFAESFDVKHACLTSLGAPSGTTSCSLQLPCCHAQLFADDTVHSCLLMTHCSYLLMTQCGYLLMIQCS